MKESEHFLKVLVELDLFPTVRILTEAGFSKEELDREQLKSIINFINKLPPQYRNMTNRDKIIAQTLANLGMGTKWGKMKAQEEALKSKKPTNRTYKTKINDENKER